MKKTRRIIIKLLKTCDKEETLKLARGKKTHYLQRNRDNGRLLIRGCASEKLVEQHLKYWKKKTKRQESYTHEIPFKNESKKKTFQRYKSWKYPSPAESILCQKKSFRQKENNTRRKYEPILQEKHPNLIALEMENLYNRGLAHLCANSSGIPAWKTQTAGGWNHLDISSLVSYPWAGMTLGGHGWDWRLGHLRRTSHVDSRSMAFGVPRGSTPTGRVSIPSTPRGKRRSCLAFHVLGLEIT